MNGKMVSVGLSSCKIGESLNEECYKLTYSTVERQDLYLFAVLVSRTKSYYNGDVNLNLVRKIKFVSIMKSCI